VAGLAIGFQRSAFSDQLSAISFQPSAFSNQLLALASGSNASAFWAVSFQHPRASPKLTAER
jgi:hypothetical protein